MIDRLALDLQRSFPGQQGFSRTNLLLMRAFADAWSETPIVLQPVRQLPSRENVQPATGPTLQAPLAPFPVAPPEPMASLPWGHNLLVLHKLENAKDRVLYTSNATGKALKGAVRSVAELEKGLTAKTK